MQQALAYMVANIRKWEREEKGKVKYVELQQSLAYMVPNIHK